MATRKETHQRKVDLVEHLRREYRSGALLPGEMLPPVRALATQFGLSKRMINEELQKLASEGWIVTVPRKGIFVAPDAQASRRFLDHAVVVLSSAAQPDPMHRQSGWIDHIAYGALKEVHARGLHSIVLHPDRLCAEVLERLAPEQPYGVVIPETDVELMQTYGTVLRERGVRVVMSGDDPSLWSYDRVVADQERGAYELTRWLIEQGRTRVQLAWTFTPDKYWCAQRREGYLKAMREAGLEPLPQLVLETLHTSEAERAGHLAAQLAPGFAVAATSPQAFLVPSDGSVAEFEAALAVLGKTQDEVLIGGYDNFWQDLASCGFTPARPAATVDKQNEVVGAEMVALLLELAENEGKNGLGAGSEGRPVRRLVAPRLVVA